MSLREGAYHLISESGNTAWNMLERRLDQRRVEAEPESIGASSTNYEYAHNTTTSRDILSMLGRISEQDYTSQSPSQEMLSHMTGTESKILF